MKEELPSKSKLVKATITALLVAVVLLVTAILPAEYGFDPLGTGAAMGLTQLSTSASLQEDVPTPLATTLTLIPIVNGPVANYPAEYKFDSVEFEIGPYEYVEYKYRLEKGASMLYSWKADAEVIHDLHGEPDGAKRDYAESFEKRKRQEANGMFTAPFSGIHGWYWENPSGDSIKVRLTTAGFYSAALEIRLDHTLHPHQLAPLDAIAGNAAKVVR